MPACVRARKIPPHYPDVYNSSILFGWAWGLTGRILSPLVSRMHYRLGHGVGRSGDIAENQPKAAGSSVMARLTEAMVLDLIKVIKSPAPACTWRTRRMYGKQHNQVVSKLYGGLLVSSLTNKTRFPEKGIWDHTGKGVHRAPNCNRDDSCTLAAVTPANSTSCPLRYLASCRPKVLLQGTSVPSIYIDAKDYCAPGFLQPTVR